MEWQPIDTAPKDGTKILVARHMGDFGWVIGESYYFDHNGIDGWVSRGRGIFGELGLAAPTHWAEWQDSTPAPPSA